MKILSLIISFASILSLCQGQTKPTQFEHPLASGFFLPGDISVIGTGSGSWKPLQQNVQSGGDGFSGTFTSPEGNEMQMTFSSKQNGNLWESNVKWEGETPFPEVFILVSYIIPSSELAQAKIVSGEMNIDIEKILSENPTRTNFSNVQDFFIDIPDKPPIHFTTPDSAEVQMILLGDNFHLRIFLTPNGQELPASGTLGWTVGTE